MSSGICICFAEKVRAERKDKGHSYLDEGSLLLQQHQPLLQLFLTEFKWMCKSALLQGLMYIKPLKTSWAELRVFCASCHHSPQCLEEKDYHVLQLTLMWTIRRVVIFLFFWSLKAKFPCIEELNCNNRIANKGNINLSGVTI